jgi:hypothetical protein
VKRFATTTTIKAPPEVIWSLLTDAARYSSWNTTVSHIDGRIALGENVTVHVKAAPGRAFPVKVVTFETPRRLVWRGGMPFGLFVGERTFGLVSAGSEDTEFTMTEEYAGVLAPLITKSIPNLQPAFDEFAACLKARAERLEERR